MFSHLAHGFDLSLWFSVPSSSSSVGFSSLYHPTPKIESWLSTLKLNGFAVYSVKLIPYYFYLLCAKTLLQVSEVHISMFGFPSF